MSRDSGCCFSDISIPLKTKLPGSMGDPILKWVIDTNVSCFSRPYQTTSQIPLQDGGLCDGTRIARMEDEPAQFNTVHNSNEVTPPWPVSTDHHQQRDQRATQTNYVNDMNPALSCKVIEWWMVVFSDKEMRCFRLLQKQLLLEQEKAVPNL